MKKALGKHILFLFLSIVIFRVTCENSVFGFGLWSNQNPSKQVPQANLKEKSEQRKRDHIRLKKEGHDLAGVDRLTREFQVAVQAEDGFRARDLLGGLEFARNKITNREPLRPSDRALIPRSIEASPQVGVPIDVRNFALGVEYLPRIPVAKIYGKTGVKWAKSAGIEWNLIEPRPPDKNGRRFYRWDPLDKLILEWQRAGVANIQLWLKCTAKWATRHVKTKKGVSLTRRASSPPKKGYWDDYAKFIRSLVERYDKDGKHDAPGLLYPIEHFQIEAEAQHHGQWHGTADEYLRLLETAYKAAKKANPQSKIILSGFTFISLLDDIPSAETVVKRFGKRPNLREQFEFNKKILGRPDVFDQVAFNYLENYKAIYGITNWIRAHMHRYGYEKPIWASDAFSGLLIYHTGFNSAVSSRETRLKLFNALANPKSTDAGKVTRWFRAYQSAVMTKKILAAMETGLIGINIGNTIDWNQAWKIPSHYQKSTAPMGLIDLKFRGKQIVSWKGRPAYYALKFLVKILEHVESITRLQAPKGVYAYKMTRKEGPLFAMWFDDNKVHLPGEDMAKTTVSLRVDGKNIQTTSVIIDSGGQTPESKISSVRKGAFTFNLSEIPLFIEGPEELTFVSRL